MIRWLRLPLLCSLSFFSCGKLTSSYLQEDKLSFPSPTSSQLSMDDLVSSVEPTPIALREGSSFDDSSNIILPNLGPVPNVNLLSLGDPDVPTVSLENLKIQIFPHMGRFALPQGRETVLNQVTFLTKGNCSVFKGISGKAAIVTGQKITLTTKYENLPVRIDCDGPTQLKRQAGLTSYTYEGSFFVYLDNSSTRVGPFLRVVNEVSFDEYLKGVVPSEIPSTWGIEALRAQAIAARSYALYQVLQVRQLVANPLYDMDDTVEYQAFTGLTNKNALTDQAVDDTSQTILSYKGKVVKAYFHAESGGHTEDSVNVWGDVRDYCVGKEEVFPMTDIPSSQWSVSYLLADVLKRLKVRGLVTAEAKDLKSLSVKPGDHFLSGRNRLITLTFLDESEQQVIGTQFSYALSLRSNYFDIEAAPSGVKLKGKGFGHGVGMSQWGARILAEKYSYTYETILKFYYNAVVLEKMK